MRVHIPGPLRSYTGGAAAVEAEGSSLSELLSDLDRRYTGIRFRMIDEQNRIRAHIKLFVDEELAKDLDTSLKPSSVVQIICAISGG
jgi:molybdopterin converting factor small subunit